MGSPATDLLVPGRPFMPGSYKSLQSCALSNPDLRSLELAAQDPDALCAAFAETSDRETSAAEHHGYTSLMLYFLDGQRCLAWKTTLRNHDSLRAA